MSFLHKFIIQIMIIFIYALEHVITSVPETKFHFLLYGMCDIISKNMFHIIIYIIVTILIFHAFVIVDQIHIIRQIVRRITVFFTNVAPNHRCLYIAFTLSYLYSRTDFSLSIKVIGNGRKVRGK